MKIKTWFTLIISIIGIILVGIFMYNVYAESINGWDLASAAKNNSDTFWNIGLSVEVNERNMEDYASSTNWICLTENDMADDSEVSGARKTRAWVNINVDTFGKYKARYQNDDGNIYTIGYGNGQANDNPNNTNTTTIKKLAYLIYAATVDSSEGLTAAKNGSSSKAALYYFFNTENLKPYIGAFASKQTTTWLSEAKARADKKNILDYATTYANTEKTSNASSATITSSSDSGAKVSTAQSTNDGVTYNYIGGFKIDSDGKVNSVTIKDGNNTRTVVGYAVGVGGYVSPNIDAIPLDNTTFYIVTRDNLTSSDISVTIETKGSVGGATVTNPKTGAKQTGYVKARIIFVGGSDGQGTAYFRGDFVPMDPDYDDVTFTAKNNLGKLVVQKVGAYSGNTNYENVKDFGFKLYYLDGSTKKYVRVNDSDTISGQTSVTVGSNTSYTASESDATTIYTSSNGTITLNNISTEYEYYIQETNTEDTNYAADIIEATVQYGSGTESQLAVDGNVAGPITVQISGNNNVATKIKLLDYRKTGNLAIEKVDADEHNTKLESVEFKLKNKDTGYYVVAESTGDGEYNISDPLKGYTQNEADGTTFVTNASGKITINGLDVGNYEIIELNNPNYGYTVLLDNVTVTITDSETITETLENEKQTGNLKIEKVDADDANTKMEDVSFRIRRTTSDEALDSGYVIGIGSDGSPIKTATGTVYFANMEVTNNAEEATIFVTDKQGLIQIKNILLGSYEVEEISVGDKYGYYVEPDNVSWEITTSGGSRDTVNNSTTAVVEITRQPSTETTEGASGASDTMTVKNEKQTGNLKIEKQDADDANTKLEGVSFRIRRTTSNDALGSGYVIGIGSDGSQISTAVGTVYFANMKVTNNAEQATTFVTDKEGLIEIYNILIGDYVVEEISVGDHYGYYVNPDYVDWEISNGNGGTSTVNNATSATIEVVRQKSTDTTEQAAQRGTGSTDSATVKNEKQTGNLKIQKKDADNDDMKLQGVSFRIRRVTSNECLGSGYVVGMQGDSPSKATPIKTATGTVHFDNMTVTNNAQEATTFVTDEEGLVQIYNILIGQYVVEEISVGDNFGYDVDGNYISWEISNSNGQTSTVNQSTSATVQVVRQKSPDTRPEVADQGTDNADQIVTKNTRKYIKIRGFAWEERTDGKNSTKDYVWNDNTEDKRLANISVKLKTASGRVLDEAITDENGEYVFGNYDEDPSAIKIEIDDLVGAYIEFEYNGMSYQSIQVNPNFDTSEETDANGNTLVKYSGNTNKSSDEGLRTTFNNNYATISQGIASNTSGNKTYDIRYNYDAENHESKVVYGDNLKYGYEGQTYPISGVYEQYAIQAVTEQSSTNALCTGLTAEAIRQNAVVEIGGLNLGVEERQMPDLFVLEDMEKVEISLNDYTHTYQYAQRFEDPANYAGGDVVNPDNTLNVAVRFANKYIEKSYSREVYASDIVYNKQPGNEGKLKIFVTYRIKITNESSSVYTTLKTLSNYYDARYENVVVRDENGNIIQSQVDNSYNQNGFKKVNIQANYQIPDGQTREMTITYQLSNAAINSILNEQLTLDSISEVSAYSSYSDSNYSVPYAGIDIDSAPGTVDTGNYVGTLEDDTDKAPSLILNVKEGRAVEGTVWEDSAIQDLLEQTGYDKERKGDGIYAEGSENVVRDVKVELLTVTGNAESGTTYELAQLYQFDSATLAENVVDASMMTTGQGEYRFSGVIPSNYVLRFTYGNNSVIVDPSGNDVKNVSANDYKSTIYRGGNKEAADAMTDYWYREETSSIEGVQRLSDAKDNDEFVQARISEDEITYGTVTQNGTLAEISADTRKFDIKLEYDVENDNMSTYSDDVNNKLQAVFDNIDFGIIERPIQSLEVGKQVANIQIMLTNGNDLINGDPRTQNLPGVRVLDDDVYIEIDNEIIQGATLRITYEISVDNSNCEIDYNNEDYYIYGTVPDGYAGWKVATVVDMYDYLPEDLVLQAEENGNWQKVDIQGQASEIKGIILADKIYEEVKGLQNVVHLANPIFENIEPGQKAVDTSLVVSKVLSTSTDDLTYENDIEIVKLKGRSPHDSIPGNYNPTTNESYDPSTDTYTGDELDDDEVEVTITPPTGESRAYWIYVIIGVSTLMIVGAGVVIIKKKVLRK